MTYSHKYTGNKAYFVDNINVLGIIDITSYLCYGIYWSFNYIMEKRK